MFKIDLTGNDPEWPRPDEWRAASASEAILKLALAYARYVLAPPIFADRLRRAGDERASPRDFECECPVLAGSLRPFCLFARRHCRFEGSGAASAEDAATMLEEMLAACASDSGGEAGKRLYMFRKSASEMLAFDLLKRIGRKYVDASAKERAAMENGMKNAVSRLRRRDIGGATE